MLDQKRRNYKDAATAAVHHISKFVVDFLLLCVEAHIAAAGNTN